MAYYMEFDGQSPGLAWIWNISGPVSPRAYSRRPDVMLVQHALNTLMSPLGLKDDKGSPITSYLKRDGYMGPKTNEYGKMMEEKDFPELLQADLRVNKLPR